RRYPAPVTRLELTIPVRDSTIALRRLAGLNFPNPIIAAIALPVDAMLLGNDAGFERVIALCRQLRYSKYAQINF
ncbi:MAG: hypothetical protein ACRER2_09035, partial [Methylococcales bacterium]